MKSELSYGRCTSCEKQAKTLDPSRLCADCRQPFIDFDHVEWFKGKGLDVAKSHAAIKKICPPPLKVERTSATPRAQRVPRSSTSATKSSTPTATPQAQTGFWERLKQWWNS